MPLSTKIDPSGSSNSMYHRTTEAREAYKKSLIASQGESKAKDLLEFWSEKNKEEKLLHEPPKYLKDVCSKLQSPTVSSLVGTRSKYTPNTSTNQSRSRSTTPARGNKNNVVLEEHDTSVDDVDGIWQSVLSDSDEQIILDNTTTVTAAAISSKRQHNNKYAHTPSKLYEPTAASLHGQFKRDTLTSPSTIMTMSPTEHKDEIPPHVNLKYAHVTSKLLAPTAATIAARKV